MGSHHPPTLAAIFSTLAPMAGGQGFSSGGFRPPFHPWSSSLYLRLNGWGPRVFLRWVHTTLSPRRRPSVICFDQAAYTKQNFILPFICYPHVYPTINGRMTALILTARIRTVILPFICYPHVYPTINGRMTALILTARIRTVILPLLQICSDQ